MRITRFLIAPAVLLMVTSAGGCSPADPVPEAPRDTIPAETELEAALASSLLVEVLADTVRFSLQVTNVSGEPLALTFPTGQSFEFEILQNGQPLWRWSEGQVFTQAIRRETLAPEETRRFSAVWTPPPGTDGEFTVRGFLTAQEHRAEQQTRFTLP